MALHYTIVDDLDTNVCRWPLKTSSEVNNSSLLITHDWKHLETWAWPHCACFVTRCRLIRNTTYLVRFPDWGETMSWPLRVIVHMFWRALTWCTRWRPSYATSFLSKKSITEKIAERAIWTFYSLGLLVVVFSRWFGHPYLALGGVLLSLPVLQWS